MWTAAKMVENGAWNQTCPGRIPTSAANPEGAHRFKSTADDILADRCGENVAKPVACPNHSSLCLLERAGKHIEN